MAQFRHSFLVVVHLVQVPFATKHEFVPVLFFVILWGETKHTHTRKKKMKVKKKVKRKKRKKRSKRRRENERQRLVLRVCVATVTTTPLLVNCAAIYCSKHSIHSSTDLASVLLPCPPRIPANRKKG
jgi:hypothetical protein